MNIKHARSMHAMLKENANLFLTNTQMPKVQTTREKAFAYGVGFKIFGNSQSCRCSCGLGLNVLSSVQVVRLDHHAQAFGLGLFFFFRCWIDKRGHKLLPTLVLQSTSVGFKTPPPHWFLNLWLNLPHAYGLRH